MFISSTQPPCEVTEESPHTVVYAQVDTVKQNGPQPPTNDDPVQYAQIEHQDKIWLWINWDNYIEDKMTYIYTAWLDLYSNRFCILLHTLFFRVYNIIHAFTKLLFIVASTEQDIGKLYV